MISTCHVVMAHAEVQATFDRHLVHWAKHGGLLMAMCPQDSVVRTHLPVLAVGTKGHHNPAAIYRFRQMLAFLVELDYEQYLIQEYDSVILQDITPEIRMDAIYSNLFTANQPEFKGHFFLHPPLMFGRDILFAVCDAMDLLPDDSEGCFWDRVLGYACESSGIAMNGWMSSGFSKNTIEQSDIPAAVAARKAGATMFHGVKSEAVLKALLSA